MNKIINYKSNECLDTSALLQDTSVKKALESNFSSASFKPCDQTCDVCLVFTESQDDSKTTITIDKTLISVSLKNA